MFVQHLSAYFSFLNSNFYLIVCIFIVKALLFPWPSFLDFYVSIFIVVAGKIVVCLTENLQAWRWRVDSLFILLFEKTVNLGFLCQVVLASRRIESIRSNYFISL